MKKFLIATALVLSPLASAQENNTYVAEHCLPASEGMTTCFKQIVDDLGNSHFVADALSWDKIIASPAMAFTDISVEPVSGEEYGSIEALVLLEYAVPASTASAVSPLDAVYVLYQAPKKCACAAAVIGGSLAGGLAGGKVGAEVGVFFGPQGAAAGVAVLGTAGAIGGGLVAYQEFCKKDGGKGKKKDCR